VLLIGRRNVHTLTAEEKGAWVTLKPSPIDATYAKFTTLLGAPTAAEAFCADYVGQFRAYANGVIYWSGVAGEGAFEIDGPILTTQDLGQAVLPTVEQLAVLPTWGRGYPTSNVAAVFPSGRAAGMVSTFENGSVYWGPTTAACLVGNGPINDAWGGPSGPLGFPIFDLADDPTEPTTPSYQCQDFENGMIFLIDGQSAAKIAAWDYTGNAFHAQSVLDAVSHAINKVVKGFNSATPPRPTPSE
jgi:uncharacterized protein with LGFP repeats